MISDAIRYGDCHKTTMEMADFWLIEKQLVHKLFKVLVPRYENSTVCYTRLLRAPKPYPGDQYKKAVLELKGNPYPSLLPDTHTNRNLIHNVLLDEAKKAYRLKKYAEIASKIDAVEIKISEASSGVKDVVEDSKTKPDGEKEAEVTDKKDSIDSDTVK